MKGPEMNATVKQKVSDVCKSIMDMGGDKVGFIILYGSAAKGKMSGLSDIDIAVFYKGDKGERFQFRMKILGRVSDIFDIQTFQDLPLYIQMDIMSTGDIIYYRDHAELFDINMKTIREYEDFKPHLDLYYSGLGV
ncbi:MAG: nucleotidyltransferase domain-containing protein [Methanosarcinales archaeon]|nr:nucleotidyltransferase domain-containing protein [Methanosarcinales archaeon]